MSVTRKLARMPFSHQVDLEGRVASVVAEGRIALEDCFDAMRDLSVDERFDPEFDVVVDLRAMEYTPTTADVRQLGKHLGGLADQYRGRIALVVDGDFMYGMARMAMTFVEMLSDVKLCVFRCLQKARAWAEGADAGR